LNSSQHSQGGLLKWGFWRLSGIRTHNVSGDRAM
jgi:hypothetical protein